MGTFFPSLNQSLCVCFLLCRYDLLDQFKKLDPTILDGDEMEVLRAFYSQIHREPTIAAYRASDRFIEQFNNTSATFK